MPKTQRTEFSQQNIKNVSFRLYHVENLKTKGVLVHLRRSLILKNRARGYKTFFMLNSGENEILNAHKYKNIKKFVFF